MADERLFNTPEDPSPTQFVEGMLVELEPKGDAVSTESPEAREGEEEENSSNVSIDDVNEDRDQEEDKDEERKSKGQSDGDESIEEVHRVFIPPIITASAQSRTLQISFRTPYTLRLI